MGTKRAHDAAGPCGACTSARHKVENRKEEKDQSVIVLKTGVVKQGVRGV